MAVAVILGHAVLAALARARRLTPLLVAAAAGASCWWLGLLLVGLAEAADLASLRMLWLDGHGASLLLATLLSLLPVAFLRGNVAAVRACVAVTLTLLTVTVALPAIDEGATVVGLVALAVLATWVLVSLVLPAAWRPVAWPPIVLAGVPLGLVTTALAVQALGNAIDVDATFTGSVTTSLGDPDPVAVPVLLLLGDAGLLAAVLAVLPRLPNPQLPAGVLALAMIGTLALGPVPVWTVVAGLALLGAALVADALRHEGTYGLGQSVAGVAVGALGLLVALPSDVLTAVVLGVLVLVAATLWRLGRADQQLAGGLLLPATVAGFVWVLGEVAGVEESHLGVPVLVILGVLAIARPRPEIEATAGPAATVAAAFAVGYADDPSVALALHLTVAGVLVSVSALLQPGRRSIGWLGGALLAVATWVRLWDVGVTAPEPYTLPSAVALLVVGVVHLRRHPEASTWGALGPALLLATVPSLLWVLEDPLSLRAATLGAACLVLVLLGARLRWSAPLVVGAAVGATVVLRELAPYLAGVPQWALIGSAGTLLTVVGVTWERRLRDLRATGSYLGALR
ncbi:SCO7613 C-terminal domain-containing membrane protein [Nocardioides sp. HB32]